MVSELLFSDIEWHRIRQFLERHRLLLTMGISALIIMAVMLSLILSKNNRPEEIDRFEVTEQQLPVPTSHALAQPNIPAKTTTIKIPPSDSIRQAAPVNVSNTPAVPPQAEVNNGEWKIMVIRAGDNLSGIFSRIELSQAQLATISAIPLVKKSVKLIHANQKIQFQVDSKNNLLQMRYLINPKQELVVTRDGDTFTAKLTERQTETRLAYAGATINYSLFMAGKEAQLPDKLIQQLSSIFSWRVNYAKDLRPGDQFSCFYEEYYLDNKLIGVGDIIIAKLTNNDRQFVAVHRLNPKDRELYYAPDGRSLRDAFLRAPVKYTRVSSSFSGNRFHPKLHIYRAHKGVDLAAHYGTPIHATADGKITFKGVEGGYGKAIIIRHNKDYSTLYAHMSRFAQGIQNGSSIKQGQVIGYVGQTGIATGPHVHYEIRQHGQHFNPFSVRLPVSNPLPKSEQNNFTEYAQKMLDKLQQYEEEVDA